MLTEKTNGNNEGGINVFSQKVCRIRNEGL
jgi:hypothetical protein